MKAQDITQSFGGTWRNGSGQAPDPDQLIIASDGDNAGQDQTSLLPVQQHWAGR